jgi:hypothetical protein
MAKRDWFRFSRRDRPRSIRTSEVNSTSLLLNSCHPLRPVRSLAKLFPENPGLWCRHHRVQSTALSLSAVLNPSQTMTTDLPGLLTFFRLLTYWRLSETLPSAYLSKEGRRSDAGAAPDLFRSMYFL